MFLRRELEERYLFSMSKEMGPGHLYSPGAIHSKITDRVKNGIKIVQIVHGLLAHVQDETII